MVQISVKQIYDKATTIFVINCVLVPFYCNAHSEAKTGHPTKVVNFKVMCHDFYVFAIRVHVCVHYEQSENVDQIADEEVHVVNDRNLAQSHLQEATMKSQNNDFNNQTDLVTLQVIK